MLPICIFLEIRLRRYLPFLLLAAASAAAPSHAETSSLPVLEELIVTGERIARTQQETAASVAVTTAEDLDDLPGPDTLALIFQQTANVTSSGAGNQGPTIRGSNTSGVLTSLESFFGGSQPRTTIQVDGRQLTFNEFVYSGESAWDIQRVEIFRGPQTTTQGRNAIAGAVYIETANPNHEAFEARLRAITGNYHTRQGSSVISGPIGDGQLAYRLAADYREQESYVRPLGVTDDIGADLRESETLNLRGKLSYQPDTLEGFDALLTYSLTDTRRPQTDSVDAPFENLTRFNPGFSVFDTRANAVSLRSNFAISDHITVTNTTTFSNVSVQRRAPLGAGNADIDSDDLTTELIATLAAPDRALSGLAGFYAAKSDSDETLNLSAFGIGSGRFSDRRDSLGVFAEATWSPAARWFLTLGGRWQQDSQDRDGGFAGVIPIAFEEEFDAFLPKVEVAFELSDNVRVGITAERGFNAGGFTFNFDTFAAETFEEETLWNYELFYRARWLDDRLTTNANIFYSDIDDLQVATLVELGPAFFANVFSNAPSARSIGAEIDARFQVTESLRLHGGIGIADTQFQSDSNAGALIDGNEFQRAPGVTAVAGIVWNPTNALSFSVFGRHSDDYYSDDANLRANQIGSHTTIDAQASYTIGQARVFVDVTNATDTFYELSAFDNGNAASVGTPRQVSIGLDVSF